MKRFYGRSDSEEFAMNDVEFALLLIWVSRNLKGQIVLFGTDNPFNKQHVGDFLRECARPDGTSYSPDLKALSFGYMHTFQSARSGHDETRSESTSLDQMRWIDIPSAKTTRYWRMEHPRFVLNRLPTGSDWPIPEALMKVLMGLLISMPAETLAQIYLDRKQRTRIRRKLKRLRSTTARIRRTMKRRQKAAK